MFGTKSWPQVEHAQIVKRARILVIDDGDFPYMPLFKRDGYNVDKQSDVKQLAALETGEYDVILLDLVGVGTRQSDQQGLGILRHIRDTNPAQIVVAYSNAEWSLEYKPFFDQADAVLHKTRADYYEFKRTVDGLLDRRFSLGFYISRAMAELGDRAAGAPKAQKKIAHALKTRDTSRLAGYLHSHVDDQVTIDRVIQVVQVGIAAAQLWMS